MLTRKKQCRYLTEKAEGWLHHLELFCHTHDADALHHLRVEIKKIRALVRLTTAQSGKKAAGHFRGLKKMFREAGAIRDAGSATGWLAERKMLSTAERASRASELDAASEAFARQIGSYRHRGKKVSRQLLSDLRSIHAGRICRWFAQQIVEAGLLLSGDGKEMHDARKKLKTILYVHRILPLAIKHRVPLQIPYLDRLQEAIGDWHDVLVVLHGKVGEADGNTSNIESEVRAKGQVAKCLANQFAFEVHRQ